MRGIWLFLILLCVTPDRATAQTPDPNFNAFIGQVLRGSDRTKDMILAAYRPLLSPEHRQIFDQIEFRTDRNSWSMFDVYARLANGKRSIVISMGYLLAADYIDFALTEEMYKAYKGNTNADADKATRYAQYFVDTAWDAARRGLLGQSYAPLKGYYEWLELTPAQIGNLTQRNSTDPVYGNFRAMVKLWSLAVVYGHEIGHHVLGHLTRKIGPQEEADADAYAFQIATKAGYNPMGVAGTFFLFDRVEAQSDRPESSRTHPRALCRWFAAMSNGWDAMQADKEFMQFAESQGRGEDMRKLDALLSQAKAQAPSHCGR